MINVYGSTPPLSIKKDLRSQEPKVYGLNFPIGVKLRTNSFNRGYFCKESGINLVKGNIIQLFNTLPGERVMLPNYGLDLRQYLFEPLTANLFSEIKIKIQETLQKQLPQVVLNKLSVVELKESAGGLPGIQITMVYSLKDSPETVTDVKIRLGV